MHDVFIVGIIFGMFSWVTWVIATNIRRGHVSRQVAQLHSKLLDRCASNQDLLSYLESEPGRQFLESSSTTSANPSGRILNAVQFGAIFSLVGGALLIVHTGWTDEDARQASVIFGSVALAAGLGFLISAAISFMLCKSWGLLRTADGRR